MMDLNKLRRRDLEQLSAYVDGELNEEQARQVEARITGDADLRVALQELKNTHKLVSDLPTVRPPKNFTLSPEMAGIGRGLNLFPLFRFATVIATSAFAVLVGADALLLRGGGLLAYGPEPARMMAADEVAEAIAVEEDGQGLLEAPLEDAVIGVEGEENITAEADAEAPEAMLLPTEGFGTPGEPGFQGLGTDTSEGFVGEATKVETTATPMARATQTTSDIEQPAAVESTSTPPIDDTPAPVQVIEPTQAPVQPEEPRPQVDPFRIAEIGLGALALLSLAITLILRRAR